MAEVGRDPKRACFFCLDPYSLLQGHTRSGRRTDLAELCQRYRSYEEAVVADPDGVARGRQVLRDYFQLKRAQTHRSRERECIWIFGATGTGKSRLAAAYAEKVAGSDYFIHQPGNLKWWDGYCGQRVVIINDLRRADVFQAGGLNYLLNITDRYELAVEVKGGSVAGNWDVCIITCPVSPDVEFTYQKEGGPELDEHVGQLIRRLSHIIELRVIDGVVQEIDHTQRLKRQHVGPSFGPLGESRLLGVSLGSVLPVELGRVERNDTMSE